MNKKKAKLMAFLLTGTILLSGCGRNKGSKAEITGAYLEMPSDTTISTEETIEIMPPIVTDDSLFPPIATIPDDTTKETEEIIPPETTEEEIEETKPVVTEPVLSNNEVAIITGTANLRTNNTTDSLIITQLQIYDKAYKILSCDKEWDLVRCNDYIGYVHKSNLDYITESYEQEYTHIAYNDIVLTTSKLNFRTLPSIDGKRHYTLAPNTELQVIAQVENGWLLVKYNGIIGYVSNEYTMSMKERAQELYPELAIDGLKPQKVVRTTGNLNFRTGPNIDFPSLGILEPYESLRVMGEYGDWYFVMTNDYNFGFIHSGYTLTLEDRNVIVDKSEQQLYLYEDNDLLFTTPVTTGKDSTPSDTGHFRINYKARNVTLTDNETYWSPVKYWMPYNGGEGLHDADWRSSFGGESYHYGGSHGCINIPPDIADDIYNNVEEGTPVLVHK